MSDPGKAVFLSYASQDAEAAKRICDALRSAGIEVWFDVEGGLETGDEWDAKIRRQIKDCVLFIPVVSANTQAREEGYFRIEWELAAQRALGIASGVAFILPVVIDDTREPEALVPDRFRTVQWTRLRGGEMTPEAKAKFVKLWSHRAGVLKHLSGERRAESGEPVGAALRRDGSGGAAAIAKPGWKAYAGLAVAIFVLVAAATWWMLRGTRPASVAEAQTASDVAKFPQNPDLAKAVTLVETLNSTPEDHALAEDLAKAVLARQPTDPETVIVSAYVANRFILRGFDVSDERYATARRLCERALALAPDHQEALHVLGMHLTFRQADLSRATQLLQRAVALQPDRARFYNSLLEALEKTDPAEAVRVGEAALGRFPNDAILAYRLALVYSSNPGDLEAYERSLDKALAIGPVATAVIRKVTLALMIHRDVASAQRWLDRIPDNFRLNDRAVYARYLVASASGEVNDAIRALNALPGDFLNDFGLWPKRLLIGDLLDRQGKPDLARREYEAALVDIARERVRNPKAALGRPEVWLLVALGRQAEVRSRAEVIYSGTARPFNIRGATNAWFSTIPTLLVLGERAKAVELLREAAGDDWSRRVLAGNFAMDPHLVPWRNDAEINALLAQPAKPTPARDWPRDPELNRAMQLIDGLESIPDDFALAEEIAKRVVDRAPADGEAATVMARVQSQYMKRGFDRTDERAALARRYAERALQLAPDEPEAMYAMACYLDSRGTDGPRAERLLRRALELEPANPRPGRELADLLFGQDRLAEALAQSQDNVRRFPADVLSRYDLARQYKDQGRYEEFGRELEATLAIASLPNAIVWKARVQFGLHNDFAGMKTWLDRVPERVRGVERAVFGYFLYAAFGGQPEEGLAALRGFPQKWFTDFEYAGPTALLNACLLELQGRTELSRQQYEVALAEIQKMRATDPGRINLSNVEFWTLLGLGRKEEAWESYRRMIEGARRPYAQSLFTGWWFTAIPASLLLGERATAVTLLRESVVTLPESRAAIRLRFQIDPRMAPFREDTEIKALLAEPEEKK